MYQEERIDAIMKHLSQYERIGVQEVCQQFNISRDTARRDLLKMEEQGLLIRTHGGAILPKKTKEVYDYNERLIREGDEKREIGAFAASLVKSGEFIMMDASTTVQFAAENIAAQNLVAVTNSIDIADVLSKKPSIRIHLLGGELNPQHRFVYGQSTIDKLADYQVDKLFLGACGISSRGVSYPHEEDGRVKREMIKRANQVIVLADHTKFHVQMFYRIAELEAIDLLITDQRPDQAMIDILHEHKVELLIVSEEER
ncbi:DeoR/GlpR transcriptional regulator [Paenibacillus sp. HN-1]|uniref:DeoR/GlpR family DNA-binding transcription regulator n=1 Tax=Paenibacillus TaxID=44249 RepID=UPI001CA8A87F|nr:MULTISPECIES: DeoR/GlpR family DNA-binding transcription regulator [Paenibacillus]MBY9079430.1 DeoR/GlpR transcriptional regulator [Paenibacillus sp. CGMCC 1.18879]MBY9085725.1 DeoR/GlpR transcriptional regulator [Paenibacillus sinensis]